MNNDSQASEGIQQANGKIRPMSFGISLLYFGVPTLLIIVCFHIVMPALINSGFLPFYGYFVGLGIPLVLLLIAALVAYKKEGNLMKWNAFKERFRLHRLSLKMWLLTIGAFILIIILSGILIQINFALVNTGIIPMPSSLPAWLDTREGVPSMVAIDQAFGGLLGNWLAVFAFFVLLCFNVIGEEIWWRGYILPRQELVFGKWVWLIHGVLWLLFHAFKWWELILLLPITLILPFLVWKFKNNTIGIILHFLINGIGLIAILIGILGV